MSTPDPQTPPPYFDTLLDRLENGDPLVTAAFGRHVHWGFWSDPDEADGSAEDFGAAAERLCRRVCDAGGVGDGARILDVGCGFGGTVASLNERFDHINVTGLNIDARQLDYARRRVLPRGDNRIAWVEADACQMPFDDATFDVVLAVECVFHFDRRRFVAEAHRVLRPGGRIALSDFCPTPRAAEYLGDREFITDAATRRTYGHFDVGCSADEYRRMADANGMRLIAEDDITPHTLPSYEFLLRSAEDSPDRQQAEEFIRATRRLSKASRKGMLRYLILTFE